MVLPNPKQTYRALLMDYDALLEASDDECSYCLSEREIQMILAMVDYIAWETRYIATETEIDPILIQHWSANLARKLMSGCCGDEGTIHRYSEGGVYQSSDDGGVTWTDDPQGDPRNSYIGAPPLPGAPSASKKCAAADNVRDLFEQYRDNLVEIVGATPTILAIIAGILAFIGVIAGVSGVGIGISVIFLTMAAEIVSIGGTGITAAITFTALETFRCLVYCRMNSDGELTYEAWQGLLADIAGEFSGFAETFFYQTVSGMGYIGVNNAATIGASTADDCGDCDCGPWCYTFDFETTDGDFTVIAGTGGVYTPGVGWVTSYWVGGEERGYRALALERTFTGTITEVTISVDLSARGSPGYPSNWVYVATPEGALISTGGTPGTPENYQFTWDGGTDVTGFNVVQVSAGYSDSSSDPGGEAILKTITIRGTGTNPFGDDNCE